MENNMIRVMGLKEEFLYFKYRDLLYYTKLEGDTYNNYNAEKHTIAVSDKLGCINLVGLENNLQIELESNKNMAIHPYNIGSFIDITNDIVPIIINDAILKYGNYKYLKKEINKDTELIDFKFVSHDNTLTMSFRKCGSIYDFDNIEIDNTTTCLKTNKDNEINKIKVENTTTCLKTNKDNEVNKIGVFAVDWHTL